jgi:hypothetical protein
MLPNGSRRDLNAELEQEFIGNPFFAPDGILTSDLANEFPHVLGQRQSASLPGFPAPERPERRSMPLNKGFRLDDYEGVSPIEESSESHHRQTDRRRSRPRPVLAFPKQSELLAEEQILCDQGRTRR